MKTGIFCFCAQSLTGDGVKVCLRPNGLSGAVTTAESP